MRILTTFILLLTVHEFYISDVYAGTKCENISEYSEEYIEVWTIFIELTQSHPEIYSKDPDRLSQDELQTMVEDITILMNGLVKLSPPPALQGVWAVEISYWATYVALLSLSSDLGSKYAIQEYARTIETISEHLNQSTRLALGYCPVWQSTIDELNELIQNNG